MNYDIIEVIVIRRKAMSYKDIYSPEFLKKFGEYEQNIANIPLGTSQEIDVNAIARACDIDVKFDFVGHSGWSINNDEENQQREIIVNQFEPEYRQRFTIAHEIGHIILGHKGKSYRTDDMTKYKNTIDRMNEVAANNFAADLIMPRNLVISVIMESIANLGYSVDQSFDEYDISEITKLAAVTLNVSKQALSYRLENLQVFIDE
jgi:Zn peptidase